VTVLYNGTESVVPPVSCSRLGLRNACKQTLALKIGRTAHPSLA